MQHCLVGTYTRGTESSGIYQAAPDGSVALVIAADNPSFLARHPDMDVVYCVNEIQDFADEDHASYSGAVSAYNLKHDQQRISLEFLNQQPSMGADPCHLSVDRDFLISANYTGGTFATLPIEVSGRLETFQSLTEHIGSGPNLDRQSSAHVHSSLLSGNDLYIADLGTDRISRYQVTPAGDVESERLHVAGESGSGPRYLAKTEHQLFVLNELNNTLCTYSLRDLSLQETVSIVPDSNTPNLGAHLLISDDQQFLYLSNRGFDSISVFQLQPKLEHIQTVSSGGAHPRHFALLNHEQNLIAANMHSNNLVLFDRNSATGLLKNTKKTWSIPAPSCVLPLD